MIWLPYPNIRANLDVLNDGHLTDVVLEGLQCLRDIYTPKVNGMNVRAWQEHPQGLLFYVLSANRELKHRGYPEFEQVYKAFTWVGRTEETLAPIMPSWYGDPAFHQAQRSNLIRVDPAYYARRMPFTTPLEIPLIWPRERALR